MLDAMRINWFAQFIGQNQRKDTVFRMLKQKNREK